MCPSGRRSLYGAHFWAAYDSMRGSSARPHTMPPSAASQERQSTAVKGGVHGERHARTEGDRVVPELALDRLRVGGAPPAATRIGRRGSGRSGREHHPEPGGRRIASTRQRTLDGTRLTMNGLPCREAAAVVIALFLPTSLLAVSGLSTPLPGGAERGFASPLPGCRRDGTAGHRPSRPAVTAKVTASRHDGRTARARVSGGTRGRSRAARKECADLGHGQARCERRPTGGSTDGGFAIGLRLGGRGRRGRWLRARRSSGRDRAVCLRWREVERRAAFHDVLATVSAGEQPRFARAHGTRPGCKGRPYRPSSPTQTRSRPSGKRSVARDS